MNIQLNNYYDKHGEKWSTDKGDWKSYQMQDENDYTEKNEKVKTFAWVILSVTFILFSVIIIMRFF